MSQDINRRNPEKVLILNNDMSELSAMIAGLELEGFDVDGSIHPDATMEMLKANPYDVIFVDLMLHSVNGLAFARQLKGQFPEVITVLMSDYLLSPSQLAKAETGAAGFVPKPCRPAEVAGFVRKKLEDRRKRGETRENTVHRVNTPPAFDVISVKYTS